MFGCIKSLPTGHRIRCKSVEICGGRFCCVEIPMSGGEKRQERRVRKAVRLLARQEIRRVVFPAGYTETAQWQEQGIEPPAVTEFRQALFRKIFFWTLNGETCRTAAVCARYLTPAVYETVAFLEKHCRYLLLSTESDARVLADRLGRECGLALIAQPTEKQIVQSQLAVHFSSGYPAARWTIPLYAAQPSLWQYGLRDREDELAATALDREQLCAALWEMGTISIKDVEIL